MAKLYKRDGSPYFWATYYDHDGKRRRRSLDTADQRIAETRLAELIRDRDAQRGNVSRTLVLWAEFRNEYLEHSKSKPLKTWRREEAAIVTLERYFPIKYLSELTPYVLDRMKSLMRKDGYGDATINRDIGALRTMLSTAVLWGRTEAQDWDRVKLMKEPKAKPRFWTLDEVQHGLLPTCQLTCLEAKHDVWMTIPMLGIQAGLRRGETYHAAKPDVDLDRRILLIRPKKCDCPDCQRNNGRWSPKDNEEREVHLSDELCGYLERLLKKVDYWLLQPRPKSLDVMTSYFRKIVIRAGLRGNLHWARHTYASWAIQKGASVKSVQDQLGHSSLTSTMVYAHLAPDNKKEPANVMPRLLGPKR